MRNRRWICAGAAAMALLGTVGCGGSDTSDSASGGDPSRELKVRLSEDPGSLDPHTTSSSQGLIAAGYLYDTIVSRTEDGRVVPALAKRWRVTPTSATFSMRDDVTCSDGTPLRASDVAANLDRLKDPKTKASYTSNFLGSTDYVVRSDDAKGTVSITLPRPFSSLLYNLGTYPAIVCRSGLEDPKSLGRSSHGTGPFVLDEAVAGDHFTLTRREGYSWGPDGASTDAPGFPRRVSLRVVPNDTTAANQLLSGELDLAFVDGPERARLEGQGGLDAESTVDAVSTLFLNQARGRPAADPKVREALVKAIDRRALTQAGYAEFGSVAPSLLEPDAPCFDASVGGAIPAYDADAAKQLLGAERPQLKLYSIGVPGNEYVAESWRQIGVDADLNAGDESGPGLGIVFGGGDWDAALTTWSGVTQLSLMTPFLSGPAPPQGTNLSSARNATFDALSAKAVETFGATSCSYANDALRAAFGAVDMVPLSYVSRGFFSKGVSYDLVGSRIEPTSLRITG